VGFDLWTLFIFGVVGYGMRLLGFPLAPMILGVVLGDVAEKNLSRALSLSDDLTLFLSRPFSLFFVLLSVYSLVFPWYQQHRGRERWTDFFMPSLSLALSLPLLMMDGPVRRVVGVGLILLGLGLLSRTLWRPRAMA